MDYRDNRQRWAESHQVVHFYAGQWCTFTPALTLEAVPGWQQVPASVEQGALSCATTIEWKFRFAFPVAGRTLFQGTNGVLIAPRPIGIDVKAKMDVFGIVLEGLRSKCCEVLQLVKLDDALIFWEEPVRCCQLNEGRSQLNV